MTKEDFGGRNWFVNLVTGLLLTIIIGLTTWNLSMTQRLAVQMAVVEERTQNFNAAVIKRDIEAARIDVENNKLMILDMSKRLTNLEER